MSRPMNGSSGNNQSSPMNTSYNIPPNFTIGGPNGTPGGYDWSVIPPYFPLPENQDPQAITLDIGFGKNVELNTQPINGQYVLDFEVKN